MLESLVNCRSDRSKTLKEMHRVRITSRFALHAETWSMPTIAEKQSITRSRNRWIVALLIVQLIALAIFILETTMYGSDRFSIDMTMKGAVTQRRIGFREIERPLERAITEQRVGWLLHDKKPELVRVASELHNAIILHRDFWILGFITCCVIGLGVLLRAISIVAKKAWFIRDWAVRFGIWIVDWVGLAFAIATYGVYVWAHFFGTLLHYQHEWFTEFRGDEIIGKDIINNADNLEKVHTYFHPTTSGLLYMAMYLQFFVCLFGILATQDIWSRNRYGCHTGCYFITVRADRENSANVTGRDQATTTADQQRALEEQAHNDGNTLGAPLAGATAAGAAPLADTPPPATQAVEAGQEAPALSGSPPRGSPPGGSPPRGSPLHGSPTRMSPTDVTPTKITPTRISPTKISPTKITPPRVPTPPGVEHELATRRSGSPTTAPRAITPPQAQPETL